MRWGQGVPKEVAPALRPVRRSLPRRFWGRSFQQQEQQVQRVPERSEGSWPTPGRAGGPRWLGQRGKDPVTGFWRPRKESGFC